MAIHFALAAVFSAICLVMNTMASILAQAMALRLIPLQLLMHLPQPLPLLGQIIATRLALLVYHALDQPTSSAQMETAATIPLIPCMILAPTTAPTVPTARAAAPHPPLAPISMVLEVFPVAQIRAITPMTAMFAALMDITAKMDTHAQALLESAALLAPHHPHALPPTAATASSALPLLTATQHPSFHLPLQRPAA